MVINDILGYNADKIETIEDFVDFWSFYNQLEYSWNYDDGDEHLMVWLDFNTLSSFTKLFGQSTIDECYEDFKCILRKDCVVFPHFENALHHLDINEKEIEKLFP